ncbi:hypothetical protein RB195_006543 [Necator americanus]|uniref:Zinc finger, C2H2 type n=1 Tax=Necator americanus TaxID=51031 RepID=A0ABR1BVW6_NECAM
MEYLNERVLTVTPQRAARILVTQTQAHFVILRALKLADSVSRSLRCVWSRSMFTRAEAVGVVKHTWAGSFVRRTDRLNERKDLSQEMLNAFAGDEQRGGPTCLQHGWTSWVWPREDSSPSLTKIYAQVVFENCTISLPNQYELTRLVPNVCVLRFIRFNLFTTTENEIVSDLGDDVLQLSQPTQDENKIFAKKRKMQLDACSIKSEPCDDDVKSVCPSGELKLDCQFCGTSFESISELQTHTLRDHLPVPVPSLECQHCCAVLPSFAAFVLHMRGHLSDRDESKCPRCPLSFSDAQARLSHVISHFEVRKPLRFCMECGVSFSDSLSLGQHFMELHLKLQHLCTVCGQSCETQKEFTEHVLNHSNEATSLECGTCRVAFESRELLAMHVQLVHDREQPFDKTESAATMLRNGALLSPTIQKEIRILHCSVCDEKCYGEDALDEHRLFSHCKVPRSDACAACQAPLLTAEDFEKHTRMHTADLYMHCAVCRQSIRSETQLSLHCQFHMERRTDGEDSEQTCGICGKVLVNRYQLNVHLMEHDERRCCPHCLRPFALAQHLLTHVSEEHGEDQPLHSCEICEENFRFAVQLENHVLKHAAETKSRCSPRHLPYSHTVGPIRNRRDVARYVDFRSTLLAVSRTMYGSTQARPTASAKSAAMDSRAGTSLIFTCRCTKEISNLEHTTCYRSFFWTYQVFNAGFNPEDQEVLDDSADNVSMSRINIFKQPPPSEYKCENS